MTRSHLSPEQFITRVVWMESARPASDTATSAQKSMNAILSAMTVGLGFDIHRLVPGRRLLLGGVAFDHPVGLLGHSDGDVVLHAVTDAILGAMGAGDIGERFP